MSSRFGGGHRPSPYANETTAFLHELADALGALLVGLRSAHKRAKTSTARLALGTLVLLVDDNLDEVREAIAARSKPSVLYATLGDLQADDLRGFEYAVVTLPAQPPLGAVGDVEGFTAYPITVGNAPARLYVAKSLAMPFALGDAWAWLKANATIVYHTGFDKIPF